MKTLISYRRQDSQHISKAIYEELASNFGYENILIDIDYRSDKKGFHISIKETIDQCQVVLVVIGHKWLSIKNEDGKRYIDDPDDFVRLEIENALLKGLRVIPVLVNLAKMPNNTEIPESCRGLLKRQSLELRNERLYQDLGHLVEAFGKTFYAKKKIISSKQDNILESSNDYIQNHIFISHSTLDREWIEKEIVQFLDENNQKTWYSKGSIRTSDQWEREILRGLEMCDWFLLVVSPRAEKSEWVKDELFWAMQHRPNRILPAIMEKSNLWKYHIRLPRIQHIDFTSNLNKARRLLLKSFRDSKS
jgi:hypothetical protein